MCLQPHLARPGLADLDRLPLQDLGPAGLRETDRLHHCLPPLMDCSDSGDEVKLRRLGQLPDVKRLWRECALEREQRAVLVGEAALAAVAAEPALRQHAVARDDDRDRVAAAGAADRARRRADRMREIAVAARLAIGDRLHRRPDPRRRTAIRPAPAAGRSARAGRRNRRRSWRAASASSGLPLPDGASAQRIATIASPSSSIVSVPIGLGMDREGMSRLVNEHFSEH